MNQNLKISIIGTSGSGKSTFAKKLKSLHVELDALYWKKNWDPSTTIELQQKIIHLVEKKSNWVIEGNYSTIQQLIWNQADTIIWIELPLFHCLWNALKRSIGAILHKQHFYGHSPESWSRLFSKKSIFLWVWRSYKRRRIQYNLAFDALKKTSSIKLTSFKQMNYYLTHLTHEPCK